MKLLDFVLDTVYPPRCPFCGKLVSRKCTGACPACEPRLPVAAAPMQEQHFANLIAVLSPLYYDGIARESLLRYKFSGKSSYCRAYAQIIAKTVDLHKYSCDYITWVPLSGKRYASRGYNQSKLLAEELSRLTGIKCGPLLKKVKNNPAQSGTSSAEERKKNVKGVYRLAGSPGKHGNIIMLVDDIVTTGATLSECAGVLREGGVQVVGVTAARNKN